MIKWTESWYSVLALLFLLHSSIATDYETQTRAHCQSDRNEILRQKQERQKHTKQSEASRDSSKRNFTYNQLSGLGSAAFHK